MGAVQTSLSRKQSIWSVRQIKATIKQQANLDVSTRAVTCLIKKQFGLGYRKVKRVSLVGNSERNRVLRCLYAQKMFTIYSQGGLVVNVDETWVPATDYRRARWNKRGQNNSMPDRPMGHRVNMITAISSEGHVWLSLTQCNTDENVMQMFLSHLAQAFTKQLGSSWRDTTTLVMDGASYHRSNETRKCISHLRMSVVLSAPYSYASAPVELWFAHLKKGSFNPENIRTGKR